MKKAFLKLAFPLISVAILAPWPIAYAFGAAGEINGAETIQITPALPENAPGVTIYHDALNGVRPGDLFYLNASGNSADIHANLYLTNGSELVHHLRSMILEVGVYVRDSNGQWQKASGINGMDIPEMYLSMVDNMVSISLPGLAEYKITIEGGSVYGFFENLNHEGFTQPRFYMTVD